MRLLFDLDCGRSVTVDAFFFLRTYLTMLEGQPNRETNQKPTEEVRTEMVPLWGERKVHVVPPKLDEYDPENHRHSPFRFTAWLTCYQPIGEPNAGSDLVVLWFRGECGSEPLAEATILARATNGMAHGGSKQPGSPPDEGVVRVARGCNSLQGRMEASRIANDERFDERDPRAVSPRGMLHPTRSPDSP